MPLPSPKHYWNFNESGGTTAVDSIGGAAMAIDRPSWVPGKWGMALRFNPRDGVRVATTALPELPPPWTASFRVKREADSESASLFSSADYALKLEQWRDTHKLGFTAFRQFDATFGCEAPIGEWIHLALVGTDAETKLYLDGRLQSTLEKPVQLGLTWLGSTGGWNEFASVVLDEVKVFDEALTEAQVAELAAQTPEIPSLLRNGDFEEGPPGPGGFTRLDSESRAIPGWLVTRGQVDYVRTYWSAARGTRSIDLNGTRPGGIKQTFATTPGAVYSVSFALAGNTEDAPTTKVMRVEVSPSPTPQAASFEFSTEGHSHTSMGWQRYTWHFTAHAPTTSIEFYSLVSGAIGPALDDVAVYKGAPGAGR